MSATLTSRVLDFSRGVIGGVNEYARPVRHGISIQNMLLEPLGALSVRLGSQRFSSATLTKKPHSTMEWVTATTGHIFVGCEDSPAGALYEAKVGAFTQQTTPYPLHATAKTVWDQLHSALWVCEQGGLSPPIFYRSSNPANTFHSGILPRPAFPAVPAGTAVSGANIPAGATTATAIAAGDTTFNLDAGHAAIGAGNTTLVFGSGAAQFSVPNARTVVGVAVSYSPVGAAVGTQMTLTAAAGGSIQTGEQPWYRLRFRYADGSSRANAPLQLAAPLAGANQSVALTNIGNEIRSDYLGWTLERTKLGGTVDGPFYLVTDGTGTTYTDAAADADLGYTAKENNHGEPPHFDGIVAYKNRLVGWTGSTLWFSQAVADIEATGIANFNPKVAIDIGPDDGDTIQAVVEQGDRLVAIKRWSVWPIEGDDITNYRTFRIYKGAGVSGPRAACSLGTQVLFWGEAGFHQITGNDVEPFGYLGVGHLFKTITPAGYADIVLKNYLGQQLLAFFSRGSATNDYALVYDVRFKAWTEVAGWYWNDLLVQKAGSFGNARAAVAIDRRDLDATGAFDYPVWLGFYGYKDEKAFNGTGGVEPTIVVETPFIDDGRPDTDKDWETIQSYLTGSLFNGTVSIILDPPHTSTLNVTADQSGALWAVPSWGAFVWGSAFDTGEGDGLPGGTVGRRYKYRLIGKPTADLIFKGYSMDGTLVPKADYSTRS